jgi:uncharacterized protein (TIGR00725 family)
MRVSVVGGSTVSEATSETARTLGRILACREHVVVCGGRSGVMAAVCRGAQEQGGHTIGILPGIDPRAGNEYLGAAVATGMGNARNALVVQNGDATIAVDGNTGTLSEIALALDAGHRVAGLETHRIDGVEHVATPEAAVEYVEGGFSSN